MFLCSYCFNCSLAVYDLPAPFQNENINGKIAQWNKDRQDLEHATFRESETQTLLVEARAEAAKIRAQASAREATLLRALDEAQAENQHLKSAAVSRQPANSDQSDKWCLNRPSRWKAHVDQTLTVSGKHSSCFRAIVVQMQNAMYRLIPGNTRRIGVFSLLSTLTAAEEVTGLAWLTWRAVSCQRWQTHHRLITRVYWEACCPHRQTRP